MNWIQKILKKFYKEKVTTVVYEFKEDEISTILANYIINERKIINLDEFTIITFRNPKSWDSTETKVLSMDIEISPKEPPIIPPPPPKSDNIVDEKTDFIPQRAG